MVIWRRLLTLAMPDRDSELETWGIVRVEIGVTVTWLVKVDVMGTWLVTSLSVVVGV